MSAKFNEAQLEAITARSNNILIAAGAGSGKSTVLVERLMRKIIDEQKSIDQFLIVTFTNLAAAEMLEKLRKQINTALEDKTLKKAATQHLQQQILLLPLATVSTFHGFCTNILRRYYYLLDLDANMRIIDEIESLMISSAVMDEFLEEMYELEDFRFLSDVISADGNDQKLVTFLMDVYYKAIENPDMEGWLKGLGKLYKIKGEQIDDWVYFGKIKSFILPILESAKEHIMDALKFAKLASMSHGYLENYEKDLEYIAILTEQIQTKTYNEVRLMLNATKLTDFPRKKKDWDKETHELAKTSRDKFKKIINNINKDFFAYTEESHKIHFTHGEKIIKILEKTLTHFHQHFTAEKLASSKVDFSDLERLSLKLLLENKEVLQEISEAFEEIMIDEYQDTNPMQEKIIKLIATAKTKQVPLFMVGDVKQAIYRFRGADPSIFQEKYNNFEYKNQHEIPDRKIDLMKNYRSSYNVIDATNFIFKQIMDLVVGKIDYNEAAMLKLGKSGDDNPEFTQPQFFIIDKEKIVQDDEEKELLEKPELEAHLIAQKIRKMIDNGEKIWDAQLKNYRPMQYTDIVLLLRSMTSSIQFYNILCSYDIPVFIETAGNLLDEVEIVTICSMLRVIDNPYQDIPLVASMRSPLFAFTEPELAEIRIFAPKEAFYDAVELYQKKMDGLLRLKIESFLTCLNRWRYVSRQTSLANLLQMIYEETSYYQFVLGLSGGELKRENLDLFQKLAVDYQRQTFKGLYGFLRHLDHLRTLEKSIPKAQMTSGVPSMKIMTIHKSKGLEFPVVIIARMDRKFDKRDEQGDYVIQKDYGVGMNYVNPILRLKQKTLASTLIAKVLHEEMLAEEMRLLYVALTRAESKIILTGVLDKEETINKLAATDITSSNTRLQATSFIDWVLPAISSQKLANPWKSEIITEINTSPTITASDDTRCQAPLEINLDAFTQTYEHQFLTTILAKQSVTQRKIEETLPLYKGIAEKLPKPAYDQPSFITATIKPTEIGTAFHQFMQHLPIIPGHTQQSLEEIKKELIFRNIIRESHAQKVNTGQILKFTKSDLYQQLLSAKKIQKELPFTMLFDAAKDEFAKAMLQGVIDLLAEFEDEVWIVDYKTDFVKSFPVEKAELTRRYDIQMKYYLQAIQGVYREKRVVAKVYFMRIGEIIEYT